MSFRLKMSQDIFEKKTYQTYEKWKGAVDIQEDIQDFGNDSKHDLNLHEAMERTRRASIKLNCESILSNPNLVASLKNLYPTECETRSQ